jgi:predicted ATPase/transcriptional regulator with XRE-family HTH domain
VEDEDRASSSSDFGTLLREFRIAAGLSQEALAERARISTNGISALERGYRRWPQRETVALLARALTLDDEQRGRFEAVAARSGQVRPSGRSLGHRRPMDRGGASALPIALTSFVGREAELAEIAALARAHRLVTLTGSGGVGKTQTVLHVGTALADADSSAVCFVDFAPVGDSSLVAAAIALAIGVQEAPARPLIETLIGFFKDRSLLLILDNCEHVVTEAASVVASLLAGCPLLRILATSREPLRAAGERVYRLPSLTVPPLEITEHLRAADAADFDAICLFADRAQAVDHRFALTDENAPTVAALCRHLDGIPLAIELAAARMNSLSLKSLAKMLDSRFQVLARGERLARPRQQTMHATIDWSYDLLALAEQKVFERLSVFAGGCTLASATAVCVGEDIVEDDVFELLSSLVDKSLVVADFDGNEPRYRLLESFSEYGREKLLGRGEQHIVARRHALASLQLAKRLAAACAVSSNRDWRNEVEGELDNCRAALEWTLDLQAEIELGQRLVASLLPVWINCALVEGRRWVRTALKLVDALTPSDIIAQLEYCEAKLEYAFGETTASLVAGKRALARYQEIGDAHGIARAQQCVGLALIYVAGTEEAKALLRESLGTARDFHDHLLTANVLRSIAYARSVDGDFAGARADYAEALATFRTAEAEQGVASTSLDVAAIDFLVGDVEKALREGTEALNNARAFGDIHLVALGLATVAVFLTASARYGEARAYAREAIDLARAHECGFIVAMALQHVAAASVLSSQDVSERRSEEYTRAARLLGFVDARVKALGGTREHIDRREYEQVLTLLYDSRCSNEIANMVAVGASMTEDQAIEECRVL